MLYEAANVMLTRYKGGLKLKGWTFAIAKRATCAKPGTPPRHHHACDAARRDRIRTGLSPLSTKQEADTSSQRSDARGREQTTARILLQRPIVGRLRFQPSGPAPSLARRERRHPQGVEIT